MSWAAHQFEIYAVQAHLPKKMRGKVSFFGIFLGDFTPDFLSKFWVYGITIGGHHYGADSPHQWHRGWPGMGFTHTLFLGVLIGAGLWRGSATARSRWATSSASPPTRSPTSTTASARCCCSRSPP